MTVQAFTFGDPVPVLDARDIWGYTQALWNGRYYEPPVDVHGLAKMLGANPHHQSAINHKVNLMAAHFRPNPLLSRLDFKRLALDFIVFGNGYAEARVNVFGDPIKVQPSMARWTRAKKGGVFCLLGTGAETPFGLERDYAPGSVVQILDPDVSQEIYGMPQYIGAVQSALLNEAATLFRRKYYVNGSHAGFILYLTDTADDPKDIDGLRDALKSSKGPGNFRNLFMYMPNGKKDGIQVIPISEVTAKDEFFNMKNVTRDDVLAAHRTPPQLLGIIPTNAGGFGSVSDAAAIFFENEVKPVMAAFLVINDWLGRDVVAFDPY